MKEPEEVAIVSEGDTLRLVVLGTQTLEEISHITALNAVAETMAECGDIPSAQLKAHYESLLQSLIDWLVRHRRNQVTTSLRKS